MNALVCGASVALQLSIREGFEIKVTEAIIKGVPVIAYSSGGIPHQIIHGVNGFLVNTGDIDTVVEYLCLLVKGGKNVYEQMKAKCQNYNADQEFFTVFQTINWLSLINTLSKGEFKDHHARLERIAKERRVSSDSKCSRGVKNLQGQVETNGYDQLLSEKLDCRQSLKDSVAHSINCSDLWRNDFN